MHDGSKSRVKPKYEIRCAVEIRDIHCITKDISQALQRATGAAVVRLLQRYRWFERYRQWMGFRRGDLG